jgi:hypothetical protein
MASQRLTNRFLRYLFLTFLTTCLFAALLNFTVDPYGIFVTPRISGFNEVKPRAAERVRVAKPYMARAATAQTIIGGNSRPELGLDPRSECWSPEHRPVFNMGIPGANVGSQVEYVKRAVASTKAKRIVLAVDFLDFLVDTHARRLSPAPPDSAGDLFLAAADHSSEAEELTEKLRDYFKALLSLETVADSLFTVSMQHNAHASTIRADGFNPAQDYIPIIRSEGQAVLFQQKNSEVARRLAKPGLGLYNMGPDNSEPLLKLRRFLSWANSNRIEVVLLINPYHTHYLVLIELAGKWDLLEQWKRDVLAITSAHGVQLWDFNAFDGYSSESPTGSYKTSAMLRWFWEPAHYRKELGDLMLASIEDQDCQAANTLPKVGVLLTPADIEPHLSGLRSSLDGYRANRQEEYKALSTLINIE